MPIYDRETEYEQGQRNGCYLLGRRRTHCTNPAVVRFTMIGIQISMHVSLNQMEARCQLQWRAQYEHVPLQGRGHYDKLHRNLRIV